MSANLIYKVFDQPATFTVSASQLSGSGYADKAVSIIDNPYAVGESNASMRLALSVKPTSDLGAKTFHVWLRYGDSAGSHKWPNYMFAVACPSGKWTRISGDITVPSGMTVDQIGIGVHAACTFDVLDFELWDGPDATKAVASHTPYATQGHLEAVYATQASLQVQSDRITSEVSARAQTDEAVSALSTRVTQTESGITTEITNRTTAVNQAKSDAISSANANTANALESYTKTADLASTDAVKDAKKAGTDAQAAASATATLIRQYADGVLVAKTGANVGALVNASGSFDVVMLTWADGVPSVSGTLSSFDADSATIGTEATPGASVDLVGGAARFYVKQWDADNPASREVRLSSGWATIILGVDDEATNGGLWIDPYRSDGTGGKAGCEWPFDAGAGFSIGSKAVKWQSAEVTLNTSSSLLGSHSASCLINPGLGLAYLSIEMSFESPGWQPGTGTWLFRLPSGLRPSATKRLYNLIQIFIGGRWGAHVDVHPDGYCFPTWGWQATNIMCNMVFPTSLLGEVLR